MNDFAQKPGEDPEAWVRRLAHVRLEGLSDYLVAVLGNWKRDAAESAARDDAPGPPVAAPPVVAPPVAAAPVVARLPAALRRPAGQTTPLEAVKRAVRALSADDMLSFTFWFTHGRADS